MNIVLLLTGSFTALGIGYFFIDAYRHRNRAITEPYSTESDVMCSSADSLALLDGNDLHAAGQTVSHLGHGAGETIEAGTQVAEHAVAAIAHASIEVISHLHH